MVEKRTSIHGHWSSRAAFVLAATGSAVGLGNIWRFPYLTGENGGGAFVLVYIACVIVVGLPLMMAEIMLGRRGRSSPINTMRHLVEDEGHSKLWELLGWSGVAAGFLILSFYSVIAGWTLIYIFEAATGTFNGATAETVGLMFTDLLASPWIMFGLHTTFIAMTVFVVGRGVEQGLEKAVKFLMPALFLILLLLVAYSMTTGHFMEGVRFLFTPDFSKLQPGTVLVALGQAFFSLSLGMGAIMAYGAYLPEDASIPRISVTVALADTGVALIAGLAIFPIVFANGLEPGQGPGLIFVTLPIAFADMGFGQIYGTLFFLLLAFAAWTSTISLIEPAVAWLVEQRGLRRLPAAMVCGGIAWVIGIGSVLSFNHWQTYTLIGRNFQEFIEHIAANIMLPLGGLAIAVYAGWFLSKKASVEEMGAGDGKVYKTWRFLVRYVTPILVIIVFLNASGIWSTSGGQ